ncbi:MAG: DMT family transporter [Myxococcales bacterium]|nr:DMT family transporter [Myxococcales bacterium]
MTRARTASAPGVLRTAALTSLAMVAFAANSILCRRALGEGAIDAASFSTVRLVSGALALALLHAALTRRRAARHAHASPSERAGSWASAAMLFLYAVPFSFAYNSLATGTGALILFGAVQATMLVAGLRSGEHPHPLQWGGLVLALAGLVYMVLPGVSAPSPTGSALMGIAGVAWGVYSLRGRGARDPLAETSANFTRSVPMVLVVSALTLSTMQATASGVLLAVASGALASGVGYAVWYAALGGLSSTVAAIVQLTVPVIAAVGGVLFMAESITPRLVIASTLILGGVLVALSAPRAR